MSELFTSAASFLSNASSLSGVSTSIKLELYGLFKYLTVSPSPSTSRPSIFDMTGRAKWDAWNSMEKKYPSADQAEQRYLDIARSLGWSEGTVVNAEKEEEVSWDSDDEDESTATSSKKGGGGGFGTTVSTMAPPLETQDDGTLHFHVANSSDLARIAVFLKENPRFDVNSLDEFGYTALHLAADRGNVGAVRLLLEKGADATLKDPDGLTALELARVAGHDELVEVLK
ncbi:ankyrin repeat-containing domain protein [Mycena floridula]|nr:ankyrin repeat-containing domain protein [Mycena floridula]